MIFINPTKTFTNTSVKYWRDETAILIKIQIDNSLELGWDRKDILLVTNFDYEYNGVKSLVVGDENYYATKPTASKITTILTLFNQGLIKNELYWFHDFDAFELEKIIEEELELDGYDLGMAEYGVTTYNPEHNGRLSTGSMFFTNRTQDIFERIKYGSDMRTCNEEISLLMMVRRNNCKINNRMKRMDVTYNFATRKRNFDKTYEVAKKPLKVIHFHPLDIRQIDNGNNNMAVCVYGKNSLGKSIIPTRLINLFTKHGIQ